MFSCRLKCPLAVALTVHLGCADFASSGNRYEIVDSSGIQVVVNRLPAADTVVVNARHIRIGSTGTEAADHSVFHYITDLEVLSSGLIVVIDNALGPSVFDEDGVLVARLGRRGRGPHEYQSPLHVSSMGDSIFISDALLRRILGFSASGGGIDLVGPPRKESARPFAALESGFLDERETGQRSDPTPARGYIVGLDRGGAVTDTLLGPYPIPEVGWEVVDASSGLGRMVNPPLFDVYPSWAVVGRGGLIWAVPNSARLEVRDLSGAVEGVIELPRPVRRVTSEDRERYFSHRRATQELSESDLTALQAEARFAEIKPAVTRLLVDDAGRIWVGEHDILMRQRSYVGSGWDVLSQDGRLLAHFIFPPDYELVRVRGSRAYGITRTRLDVHVVDIYEIGVAGERLE